MLAAAMWLQPLSASLNCEHATGDELSLKSSSLSLKYLLLKIPVVPAARYLVVPVLQPYMLAELIDSGNLGDETVDAEINLR